MSLIYESTWMRNSAFLSVSPQVVFEVSALQEASAADVAAVRSFSGVAPHVLPQMSAVGETLAAEGAAERLLSRVNPHVDL